MKISINYISSRPKIDVLSQKWRNFGNYWLENHIFCFFFCLNPQINCLVWEERKESKFGGSWADLHQTSKVHNGLFLHLQYQAFKSFGLLKLIKNQLWFLKTKYPNVRATVKKWDIVWPLKLMLARVINKIFRDSLSVTPCIMIRKVERQFS